MFKILIRGTFKPDNIVESFLYNFQVKQHHSLKSCATVCNCLLGMFLPKGEAWQS